jgi:hypothetical protein
MNLPRFTMLQHVHARPYARRMALFITLLLAMGSLHGLKGDTTDGPLRMEVITAYNFVVDSNIESPAGKSPSAAHLGVKIHNDGPAALTNVEVNLRRVDRRTKVTMRNEISAIRAPPLRHQGIGWAPWRRCSARSCWPWPQLFDSTTYNPEFGYYTSTVHVISDLNGEGVYSSNPEASPENFSGLVAYLWIRNEDLPGTETEWLLVRADEWVFPSAAGDCCDTSVIEWSISDLSGTETPLYGNQGGIVGEGEKTSTSSTGLQTFTFVPEPSTATLAALAALSLLRRRRENS